MSRAVLCILWCIAATAFEIAPAVAEPTGVLRVGLPSVPAVLDPAIALDGPLPFIARQVFDTLVRYVDGSSDIEPALAAQWSVSKDGLVWTFRLRDGVRFHDGTLFTAQHVVDSFQRVIQPGHPQAPPANVAVPRLIRGTPGVIREIKALNARTVAISVVLPYAPLLTVLAHPALSIVAAAAPGNPAIPFQGTGPFAVVEAFPGRLALEGRPGHWAGGPRLSSVVFSEASDPSQAMAGLDGNLLDAFFPAGAPPRQSGAMSIAGWQVGYLTLQTEKEPFSRPKIRRGVAAALDPARVGLAAAPSAVPLQGFLPVGVWARRDGKAIAEGAPEAAKRLFAEGGLRRGVSPTLLVVDGDKRPDMSRVAEAVRASLAAADFPVTVRAESLDAAVPLVQAGEHAMALLEARVDAGDPHLFLYPLSASEAAVKGPQAANFSFYRNNRLDDVLIRASQLSFRPERQRLYIRAQAALADEVPWIPLYVRLQWAVLRPEVKHLRLHPSGNHRLDRVAIEAAGSGVR